MNVLAQLSDAFLARHFDAGTLQRAREVVAAGFVRRPEIGLLSAGSVTATAEVQGSRVVPYQVQLHAEAPSDTYAGWLFTVCTCPVQAPCKHGAALALTLRQTFTQPAGEAAWRRSLERLVSELDRQQPRPHDEVPLALEISLEEPRSHYRSVGPTLRVRPMRQGKNKPWIKTGADWSDVGLGGVAQGFPKEQADAISALHALWAGHRAYYYAGVAPSLDEFGENVVRALRNARDAGVTLIAAHPLRDVVIADEPAEVVAELTDVQGGTSLRAAVTLGEQTWRGESVIAIGNPASVVGLNDAGTLVIAATTSPVPAALRHLLDGPPIVVPPSDLADFRDSLPGLMRHLPVRAEAASVDLPEPLRPVLVLTVTWHTATKAGLAW
ncbi:SWIM zinc finger domain-containing protein, partial [Nocardioides sp. GCM10030258]|uniref:SWIM zinc finger family protein n=1 Tax=unclassified Nocardioides TaxID=2615069 RepID=UPI0036125861